MVRRIDISKRYDYSGFFGLLETNKLTEDDFLVLSGLQDHRLLSRMRYGMPVPKRIVTYMAHFFGTDINCIVKREVFSR